ncbi:hypothetical protein [Aquisphaera insulae]|uniref:hypothetical protein n=1 Tax=Aquisphaera insulae TaxID=2712864 RepID=UPI0013EB2FD5|nr:hypothetical protein [Aquisphaera insulae]
MGDILTAEQIGARFAPDWVLIGDPQTDEQLNVQAGVVLFHSPDRDEVYRKARELRPGRFAVRYYPGKEVDQAHGYRTAS